MVVDYGALAVGQRISSRSYEMRADVVSQYAGAVGDGTTLRSDDGAALAPPMAVAALSLRGVVQDLQIPGGTLHASQEMEFLGAVSVGAKLECVATMAQNSVRGGWRFMVVRTDVADGEGRAVMVGKSTIMVPA